MCSVLFYVWQILNIEHGVKKWYILVPPFLIESKKMEHKSFESNATLGTLACDICCYLGNLCLVC